MAGGGIKVNNTTIIGGADGATFIPSVDENGNLSWSNNKGYRNPTTVNIKGKDGSDGKDGKTGAKLENQQKIAEEPDGYVYRQLFNDGTTAEFTAPRGPQGEKGDKGEKGDSSNSTVIESLINSIYDITVKTSTLVTANTALLETGGYENDTTAAEYSIVRYAVKKGTKMFLRLSKPVNSRFVTCRWSGSSWANPETVIGDMFTDEVFAIVDVPAGAKYLLVTVHNENTTNEVLLLDSKFNEFYTQHAALYDNKFMRIAYSTLGGVAPINSVEHFLTAARLDFDAIKCDIQPTSDGVLICCHDDGFTFDENGRITTYDSTNATLIHNLTYAEIETFEYAALSSPLGHYAKVATLAEMLEICKEYGKVPFVTIRNDYMDTIVPTLVELLTTYGFDKTAIINSYSLNSLKAVKEVLPFVFVSFVQSNDIVLTNTVVDAVKDLYCGIITMVTTNDSVISQSASAIAYAKQNNVRVYNAANCTFGLVEKMINAGFSGSQLYKNPTGYQMRSYVFTIKISTSGEITFNNVGSNWNTYTADLTTTDDTISISNIKLNGSSRKFADGIMPLWFYWLPYNFSYSSESGREYAITWNNATKSIDIKGKITLYDVIKIIVQC